MNSPVVQKAKHKYITNRVNIGWFVVAVSLAVEIGLLASGAK